MACPRPVVPRLHPLVAGDGAVCDDGGLVKQPDVDPGRIETEAVYSGPQWTALEWAPVVLAWAVVVGAALYAMTVGW
jgi:hypothetical protein